MPQRSDKWKALFSGLGRPTKRGVRKCPKCGTVNGTRGNSCKNKSCDVVFRDNGAAKKASTEACRVSLNIPDLQVFSVRLRDRGPDYRNFVQLPVVRNASNSTQAVSTPAPAKCYVDACVKSKEFPCSHVLAAQRCFSESQPLVLKHSAIPALNIPPDQQQTLSVYMNEMSDTLVQRVSKTSFVVKCAVTMKHPLGFLHIMFFRHKEEGNLDKKFLCTCKPFKPQNRTDAEASQTNTGDGIDFVSKLCIHYYTCLCAFASDDSLSSEFEYFLSHATQDCTPTLLSQLHLVTLPPPAHTVTVNANQISVEIMQENISFLESIAADETTLQNVQGLDGVLSDQIIVTNVDDSLTFGDGAGLDSLDDSDSQVCQIFGSAPTPIQLNTFSNAENVQQPVSLATSSAVVPSPLGSKRRRQNSSEGFSGDVTTISAISGTHPSAVTNQYDPSKTLISKVSINRGFHSAVTLANSSTMSHSMSQVPLVPALPESQTATVNGFEAWLAGVNERINATMNYQFFGKPDPIVYYISAEYFECLKERITSGVKKKRLPNQTVIIARTNKPPAGTFTKHVWKITNIIHILQIFQNSIMPLKVTQYFIKGANGIYEEWTPPGETDRKNQLIKPHLHNTFLRVGKSDPNAVESVPFVIEWIPDILPHSKLGELSLAFEFGRSAPRDEGPSLKNAKTVQ